MIGRAFDWALSLTLAGAGAWLLTQLLRVWTGPWCSARWQYRLRLAALAAFLLPVGKGAALALGRVRALAAPLASGGPEAVAGPSLYVLTTSLAAASPLPPDAWGRVWDLLPWLWLAGAGAVALVLTVRQARFRRALLAHRKPVEDPDLLAAAEAVRVRLGLGRAPALYCLPGLASPMGAGLLRPAVYLPDVALDNQEREVILAHELTHIRRRDLWVKWAALLVCALHWYDPFAWLMREELGTLCELACDEAVTADMDAAGKRRYGAALLDVLCRAAPGSAGVCAPLCGGASGLRRRLRSLLRPQPDPRKQRVCTALAALALCAALPLTGAAHAWAAPSRQGGSGGLADYRAWEARHSAQYAALGVEYDPLEGAFFYRGQRLALFVDERPMSAQERERYPWCGMALECSYRDPDLPGGLCLRTLRDGSGALMGVEPIPPGEAADLLRPQDRPVTYHSRYVDPGRLYASDPDPDALPSHVLAQALALEPGTWTALREPEGEGETGYLCYAGASLPWKLDLRDDGGLDVYLYTLEGGDAGLPTVIRYAAVQAVGEIRVYLDGGRVEESVS